MTIADRVFMAIKEECEKQPRIAEINCFETIAARADVPVTRLGLYLGLLQEQGLIRYSIKDNYMYLTALGRSHVAPVDAPGRAARQDKAARRGSDFAA